MKYGSVRFGYLMAVLAAALSGFAIYVNSVGVSVFRDATLYTTLKNGFAGLIVLVPLVFLAAQRRELAALPGRRWAWLAGLAVIGGSVPYVLFFEGLRQAGPVTGSLLNHLQFAVVAALAVAFLRERISPLMWTALAAILVATLIGANLGALRWGRGAWLVLASTVLFGAGFVISKHLLRELSAQTVVTAKMTMGSVLLFGYAAATGHLARATALTLPQWEWVVWTGIILAAFSVAITLAIKYAPVTAVLAIGTAAPLVTVLLDASAGHRVQLGASSGLALALLLVAAAALTASGWRREQRTA